MKPIRRWVVVLVGDALSFAVRRFGEEETGNPTKPSDPQQRIRTAAGPSPAQLDLSPLAGMY